MDKKLKNFFDYIETFYQPEHPELKDGIGHEVEHIKGVMRRAAIIADIINENPQKYNEKGRIDKTVNTLVASLHDIGNVIGRENHNHYALGIAKGYLNIEDILNIPFKANFGFISKEMKENILNFVKKSNGDYTKLAVSGLSKDEQTAFRDALTIKIQFDIKYYKEFEDTNENNLKDVIMDKFKVSENIADDIEKRIKDDVVYKIAYDKNLENITKNLHEIYPADSLEIQTIADAVQDHNIDWCLNDQTQEKERYVSRTIYGKIISDADKDNIFETFAIRTLAFAINQWAHDKHKPYFVMMDEKGNPIRDEQGQVVPNIDNCIKHILHQANERFRLSLQQYKDLSITATRVLGIFAESLEYKNLDINKIKGCTKVDDINKANCMVNKETLEVCYRNEESNWNTQKDWDVENSIYIDITQSNGDDIYSELDALASAISGKKETAIIDLRKDFLLAITEFADPQNEQTSIKRLRETVYKTWVEASSIEDAIDVMEKEFYEDKDNSFIHVCEIGLEM